jgi:hypothetical protein
MRTWRFRAILARVFLVRRRKRKQCATAVLSLETILGQISFGDSFRIAIIVFVAVNEVVLTLIQVHIVAGGGHEHGRHASRTARTPSHLILSDSVAS